LTWRDGKSLAKPESYRYFYDVHSRLTNIVFNDGTIQKRNYDKIGTLIGMTYLQADNTPEVLSDNRKLMEFQYQFDLSGNRTGVSEKFWDATDPNVFYSRLMSYQYDAAGRLVSEQRQADGVLSGFVYQYDAAGNRISMTQDVLGDGTVDVVTSYTFDEQDRLRTTLTAVGPESLRTNYFYGVSGKDFVASGFETREVNTDKVLESVDYDFDLFGFLEKVERTTYQDSVERFLEEYTSDPYGERLTMRERRWKNSELLSDKHWYELRDTLNPTGHSQVLELRNVETGKVERLVVPGLGLLAEAEGANTFQSYLGDALGSVRRWGSENPSAFDQHFSSFGELESYKSSSLMPLHGYTGEMAGADGGLLHLRQRSYDPKIGRFLQPDSFDGLVTEPASLHRYIYAANNPLKYKDPSGNLFVFFDGTWNHDRADLLQPHEAFTNVVKLRDAHRLMIGEDRLYFRGVGNSSDNTTLSSQLLGGVFAYGLSELISKAVSQALDFNLKNNGVMVAGFSRGATASLEFAHALSRVAPDVRINGLFLFDTVASIGLPGNGINIGFNTSLAPNVRNAYHAVAFQEDRSNFPATNIQGSGRRVVQKVFWGTHGDVGGGYRDSSLHSDNTLFWITSNIRKHLPMMPIVGRPCLICNAENNHWPHPPDRYVLHGGRWFGELFRPTVEYPAPGAIALAFFYDDMDFEEVGVDASDAQINAPLSVLAYLIATERYASPISVVPYIGAYASAAYRLYHYASVHASLVSWFANRV